jgi:hypothetical protein
MRGKIERPNGVGLFKELLFIRPNVLGLHPTLNQKKNVRYFLQFSGSTKKCRLRLVIDKEAYSELASDMKRYLQFYFAEQLLSHFV